MSHWQNKKQVFSGMTIGIGRKHKTGNATADTSVRTSRFIPLARLSLVGCSSAAPTSVSPNLLIYSAKIPKTTKLSDGAIWHYRK